MTGVPASLSFPRRRCHLRRQHLSRSAPAAALPASPRRTTGPRGRRSSGGDLRRPRQDDRTIQRVRSRMDADFCVEALEEAMARHGWPKIFNTDQGRQFTSARFSEVLTAAVVKVSMDGEGRFATLTSTEDRRCRPASPPAGRCAKPKAPRATSYINCWDTAL